MGTIAQELTRIQTAKSNIKTSIESKGVQVPSNALISTYHGYIDQIQTGTTPVLNTLNATANGTYTPPTGVDGYNQVNVNVALNIGDFDDATDLFYGGRLFTIENDLLQHFTGSYLYEAFGMSSAGPTQAVMNKWATKAVQNAGPNDLASFQLMMSYNTTHQNEDLTLDLSNVVLNNNVVLVNLNNFCQGSQLACQKLIINLDNASVSPYKIVALSANVGQSRFTRGSFRMWTNASNFSPSQTGYSQGYDILVYKNVGTNPTTIQTASWSASGVPLQCVADSIPYYSDNIGPVVWRLPTDTYNALTQTMIDQAGQYNLTFTT